MVLFVKSCGCLYKNRRDSRGGLLLTNDTIVKCAFEENYFMRIYSVISELVLPMLAVAMCNSEHNYIAQC